MKDSLLSAHAVDCLIEQVVRDGGFRIRHTVRSSFEEPNLRVIFDGPDAPLLRKDDGTLLQAIACYVSDALGLTDADSHRIAFNLGYEEADLTWEFHRCADASAPPPVLLDPQRTSASCISDELWEQLHEHPMMVTTLSMN